MNQYHRTLNLTILLHVILAVIGFLASASPGLGQNAAFAFGHACIVLALVPVVLIIRQVGTQKALLCCTAVSLAPIWFLYLEGVIEHERTAYILAPYLRVKGYSYALVYMALFYLVYSFAFKYLTKRSNRFNGKIANIKLQQWQITIGALLAFSIPIVIIGSTYSSLDELWHALTDGRSGGENGTLLRRGSSAGGSEAFLMPLMWLWQLTPSLAALSVTLGIKQKQGLSFSVFVSIVCGAAVAFFTFLGGSRGMLIFVLAIPFMLWFYYGIKLGIKFWAITITGFFLIIGIMEFQVKTRGNMLDSLGAPESVAIQQSDGETTTMNPLKSHRDNNLYFLCLVVDRMPEVIPFEGFNDFFALLANPIPRAIWPGKPLLSGAKGLQEVKLVYASGPLQVGTSSLSSSIVGQTHQWGGVFGYLPVILIYALLAGWFDAWFLYSRQPTLPQIALQGFAAFMVFWGFRDFSAFITFIYPFILLYIIAIFLSNFGSSSPRKTSLIASSNRAGMRSSLS